MRKKSTLVEISSVWCFLKSTRPVYYQMNLNWKLNFNQNHFSSKKPIFLFSNENPWIERQLFGKKTR